MSRCVHRSTEKKPLRAACWQRLMPLELMELMELFELLELLELLVPRLPRMPLELPVQPTLAAALE